MMKRHLFFAALLASCLLTACFASTPSKLPHLVDLKKSVLRMAKAGPNYSQDTESLWAFEVADSIATTISALNGNEAEDLASAYKALSYIAYGLNYGAFPMVNYYQGCQMDYLKKTTACVVDKNAKVTSLGKELHQLELL